MKTSNSSFRNIYLYPFLALRVVWLFGGHVNTFQYLIFHEQNADSYKSYQPDLFTTKIYIIHLGILSELGIHTELGILFCFFNAGKNTWKSSNSLYKQKENLLLKILLYKIYNIFCAKIEKHYCANSFFFTFMHGTVPLEHRCIIRMHKYFSKEPNFIFIVNNKSLNILF